MPPFIFPYISLPLMGSWLDRWRSLSPLWMPGLDKTPISVLTLRTVTVFTVLLSVRLSPGGWGLCLPWSRIFGFRALCLGKLALESVGRLKWLVVKLPRESQGIAPWLPSSPCPAGCPPSAARGCSLLLAAGSVSAGAEPPSGPHLH